MKRYAGLSSAGVASDTRRAVYRRDGFMCVICGDPRSLQIHHFVPRGKGGSDEMDNLVTLCGMCHGVVHKKIMPVGSLRYEDYLSAMEAHLRG